MSTPSEDHQPPAYLSHIPESLLVGPRFTAEGFVAFLGGIRPSLADLGAERARRGLRPPVTWDSPSGKPLGLLVTRQAPTHPPAAERTAAIRATLGHVLPSEDNLRQCQDLDDAVA